VPRIAEFSGIVIRMYHTEHHPPHFHATYGEHQALVGIDPIEVVSGRLPARARRLVLEWAALHQLDLTANWQRARRLEPLERIDPLP